MRRGMKLKQLAELTGKSVPFLITLQKKYSLPAAKDYSEGYAVLVQKLIHLTVCAVPRREIETLLDRERKLLELLRVDSVHDSSEWFENLCAMAHGSTRLLLSGYELGHPICADAVQTGLDFSEREKELFGHREMGADVLRALRQYAETYDSVRMRLRDELAVLRSSLSWVRMVADETEPEA